MLHCKWLFACWNYLSYRIKKNFFFHIWSTCLSSLWHTDIFPPIIVSLIHVIIIIETDSLWYTVGGSHGIATTHAHLPQRVSPDVSVPEGRWHQNVYDDIGHPRRSSLSSAIGPLHVTADLHWWTIGSLRDCTLLLSSGSAWTEVSWWTVPSVSPLHNTMNHGIGVQLNYIMMKATKPITIAAVDMKKPACSNNCQGIFPAKTQPCVQPVTGSIILTVNIYHEILPEIMYNQINFTLKFSWESKLKARV